MTTFSVTDRSNFKTCRLQWDHTSLSRQGLERPMPNRALLLGTLVHYTFADWLKCPDMLDPMWVNPVERFHAHFKMAELDIYKRYAAKFNAVMDFQEFESQYGEPVRDLGAAMMKNYFDDDCLQDLLQGMRVIAVEQPVTIPVPGTFGGPCNQMADDGFCDCNTCQRKIAGPAEDCQMFRCTCCTGHHLEGTFDALLADAKGRILIVDHKTFERRPSQGELLLNDQFLAYPWLAEQLGLGQVVGVIYNGLWKRAEVPKGRTREDLFFKTFIPHSQGEIRDFGERLAVELNEMGRPDVPIYLNRNWYSCPNCGIKELCLAKTRGEDYSDELDELAPRVKSPAWRAS